MSKRYLHSKTIKVCFLSILGLMPSFGRASDECGPLLGSEAQFRRVVLSEVSGLKAYASSLTRNASRVDDLVQTTLTNAWNGRAKYNQPDNHGLMKWLFTIMHNAYLTEVQKFSHKALENAVPLEDLHNTIREEPSQEVLYAYGQIMRHFDSLLGNTAPVMRLAIDGLEDDEIANFLQIPIGTVKSRKNRARRILAEFLEGHLSETDNFSSRSKTQ